MSESIHNPIVVRNRCLQIAKEAVDLDEADEGKFSAMLGHLGNAIKQPQDSKEILQTNRRIIQAFLFLNEQLLFTPLSSKTFTPAKKIAIMRWVGSTFDDTTQKWITRSTFKAEANWILNFALYIYASTLQTGDKTFGQYLQIYSGAGTGFEITGADYWLKQAMELPGAILTKIYPEPEKHSKEEKEGKEGKEEKEIVVEVVTAKSFDFEGY